MKKLIAFLLFSCLILLNCEKDDRYCWRCTTTSRDFPDINWHITMCDMTVDEAINYEYDHSSMDFDCNCERK